ncbi:hypothetical protein OSB04_012691 [Centaurea solstitialis]|uniref:Uncharacterized protein n=1 Tax=Centaurea solstitialis TaxID=347529 RepID=A0AA38WET8_9ASTR|nr:hypothetical protein OSB04_012691 [Centaurea solstitialis]
MIFTFVWAGWEGIAHDSRIPRPIATSPKLMIRGNRVVLSGKAFNKLFDLDTPKKTEYSKLVRKARPVDFDDVMRVAGKPRTYWNHNTNPMSQTFQGMDVNAEANVWMKVIRHSFAPTTHDSNIKVERMYTHEMVDQKGCATIRRGVMVNENREKWVIDLKAVTWLSKMKYRGTRNPEMANTMYKLLSQQSMLLDIVFKQRNKCLEKIKELRKEILGGKHEKKQKKTVGITN